MSSTDFYCRDRAPFVLTSDMAYVINGGDRPTEKFHQFVDLCCQAFNIIRNNRNMFLFLVSGGFKWNILSVNVNFADDFFGDMQHYARIHCLYA